MNRGIKNIVKPFVPPVLIDLLKPASSYGWKGDFSSWEEASKQCGGYSTDEVVEKVKESTLKVRNGKAVYERDSVIFQSIQYSWPLITALMWVAAKKRGSLKVLDIGGSLGSTYFQNRNFLRELNVQWNIVEQPRFVACGQQYIQDERIQFHYSIQECINKNNQPDIVLISCTLPYLQEPYLFLEEVMRFAIEHIVIDNTFFNWEQRNRIAIQKVDPVIYDASYPCWFLNYEAIRSTLTKQYHIHTEYQNELSISFDGHKIQYQGLLAVKR